MKREIKIKIMILFMAIFSFLVTGCSNKNVDSLSNSNTKNVEFKSEDGNESIKALSSWKDDLHLSTSATIHISDRTQDKYVMAIKQTRESFRDDMKLSDYTDIVKTDMEKDANNVKSTKVEELSLDGNQAEYFEMSGEFKKIKMTFMVICFETSDNFYKVTGWTLTTKFKDNKNEIREVMKSFKLADNADNMDSLNNSNTKNKEFKSKDGKEKIKALSSWKDDTNLNDSAIIHISDRANEKYAMVFKESKDLFSNDLKLSDYTDMVKTNMESAITNDNSTKVKESSLDGNRTEYFEMSGKIKKIEIKYMVMCIETSDNFYQVIGWTLTTKFKENNNEIWEVMNSFMVTE